MKELKNSEIKELRESILKDQNYTCPLCGKHITENDRIALDHQHKIRKTDINGIDGNGQIRGVLCADCNCLEGKIFNSSTRFLHQPSITYRISWLVNLVKYYEKEPLPYIHPSEVSKEPNVSKRQFNKLAKAYKGKTSKILEYPKSGKLTKLLKKLFADFGIDPHNTK